jgi:beta-galactosidase
LEAFVREGGRLLMMAQSPDFLTAERGLRVSGLQSRRVFRIDPNHPVLAGLDDLDLRDWAGSSTLLEAYPDYIYDPKHSKKRHHPPYYGWRWGTRGTVSSAAIEKPHRSAWRPLLECEFDLAYSPLMELDFGNGRIVWSQLDVEDHAAVDPAAAQLARQLFSYAINAPLSPRLRTVYLGDEAGAQMLDSLGVRYEKAQAIPQDAGLLIIGNDTGANVDDARLREWVERGGRLLVLPRYGASAPLGVTLAQRSLPNGSLLTLPDWPELGGFSLSDTRWRTSREAWLVDKGAELAADGQVARLKIGKGVALFCQFDPARFDADTRTYFRLTRWRQTRAVSQLLANVGAEFAADAHIFKKAPTTANPLIVNLATEWKAKLLTPRSPAQSPEEGLPDPGASTAAQAALAEKFDDKDWQNVLLPDKNESFGKEWDDKDGESVFRKTFDVGPELLGKELSLDLGTLDDNDDTYVNGVRVGGRGDNDAANWSVTRSYSIPPTLLRAKGNVIAIRIWDRFGGGGFTGKAETLRLYLPGATEIPEMGFYHPDYRTDFEMGDDPYRFYNW